MKEKFEIINASAGSGKTFSLASKVIFSLLAGEEDSYKKILALTFTNNSANEMKKRILDELKQISTDPLQSLIYQSSNLERLFTAKSIKAKAKRVLNKVLHNYSFFQVSTIDKFNHRLIRCFSNDLDLSYDFDLVIERDEFSDELIESFFNDLEKESFLLDLIVDYSNSKHDKNKSWDISFDIKKLLSIIWDENNYKYISNKKLDKGSFEALKNRLELNLKTNSERIKEISLDIEKAISNIDKSSFSYNALPKILKEAQSNNIDKIKTQSFLKRLENNSLLKKDKLNNISTTKIIEITPSLRKMISLIENHKTYVNLYGNLNLNYLIYNIVEYATKFQRENNLLLISDFNSLITENISGQPAPFIYEKIGTKFSNYFIDEFQDTSDLQWNNLVPLTSHSVMNEELNDDGGNLFIVGDPKQSVYRWRGANPETFTNLQKSNPFFIKPKIGKLEVNYRSYSNIVDFNNKFFSHNSKILNSQMVSSVYGSLKQGSLTKKKGGYLAFNFIKPTDETYEEISHKKVLNIIKVKESQGFNLSDIAILCRTNKECNAVSAFLISNNKKVNSEELLALSSSQEVLFIIDIIKLLLNKKDDEAKKNILKFVCAVSNKKNKYEFIQQQMSTSTKKMFSNVLNIDYEIITNLDFYQASKHIISNVNYIDKAKMQVYFLLDEIYTFCHSKSSYFQSFIDYWNIKKDKLKVDLIEETDAVRVLTIHKSKGLEFPVVILPYFDFKLKKPERSIWVNFSDEEINGDFLVDYNQSLRYFNPEISKRMHLYDDQMLSDNLNVMYVSMSRAILENHIICENNESNDVNSSGSLLKSYVFKNSNNETPFFKIGNSEYKNQLSTPSTKKLSIISTESNRDLNSLNNYYKSDKRLSSNFGNIFHNIMSEIEYQHQSEYVINDFYNRGIINNSEKKTISNYVDLIINHKLLRNFFSKKNIVYNEREIFLPPDKVIKPDKTVFTPNSNAFILDYKTGKKNDIHQNQIKKYAEALKKANYRVKGAFIVYLSSKIDVLEITV